MTSDEHGSGLPTSWPVTGVRVAITGGSNGIGLAMASALVRDGAQVYIGSRDPKHVTRALDLLRPLGDADGMELNVTREDSVQSWVKASGGIDVLINNAGIGMRTVNPRFHTTPLPFWEAPVEAFRAVIATNLTGYFLVAKTVVPMFLAQGRGKIVNISMNHATMRRRGFSPYGPSRAGAESLSHIMAEDLKEFSIDVNMLLPGGATDTGMIPDSVGEEFRRQLLSPHVMDAAIGFLCSNASDGLTDERLVATEFESWWVDYVNADARRGSKA